MDYSDDYDIVLNGTGTGTMDYSIRYYNKDDELETEYVFTDVAITPQTVLTTGSDQNNIVLNLDRNSDGKVEQILEPGDYSGVGVMNRISDTCYLFSSDTIDVAYNIGSQYGNNYHVNMTITNKTDTTIHNWKLEYDSTDTIHSIWNGVVVDGQDYTLIKNAGYNQDILPVCRNEIQGCKRYWIINGKLRSGGLLFALRL